MGLRDCPFCGKKIPDVCRECVYCHETVPPLPVLRPSRTSGQMNPLMRRGLLYMLLAAVIYYFASGSSPLQFPVPFAPMLVNYLLPFFFLAGLGLTLYGLFQHVRG